MRLFENIGGHSFRLVTVQPSRLNETTEDDEAEYVEYLGPYPGEEPFMLNTPSGPSKFEYCYAKYPSGKKDIGVYSYRGDMCYGYQYFRQAHKLP